MTDHDSTKRILLVEDDERLADLVKRYLEQAGLQVFWEAEGENVARRLEEIRPHVVLLDVMLPGKSGFDVCKEIRNSFPGSIAMLTAKDEDIDEVLGLELGADDYIAKPVRPRVLLARVNNLLRRDQRTARAGQRVEHGAFRIDAGRREAWVHDTPIELTTNEFDLLWLLASRAGEILDRDTIYQELRGVEYDGLDRAVDLCVSRLRRKLGDSGMIKSVRGTGYLFVAP